MLNIKELDSWLDFEEIVKKRFLDETERTMSGPIVYRGQPNAEWHLDTTLERAVGKNLTVKNYYRIIDKIHPKIETFTDQKWDLPSYEDFYKSLKECPSSMSNPAYPYMTYLRHFGFPSPLLDWTRSPFVAAFFAFRDMSSSAKSVAIYQLIETIDMFDMPVQEDVQIFPMWAFPRNNKRHELQQGVYTLCLKEMNGQMHYVNHEDPFIVNEHRHPYFTKYILPASERFRALYSLNAYNINSYSLFGTEESLLESFFMQSYIRAATTYNIYKLNDINDVWQ